MQELSAMHDLKHLKMFWALHVTENDNIIGVEEDVVGPACEGCVGVVQSPSQSVVTVSDLTAVGGGGEEGLAAQVKPPNFGKPEFIIV